MGIRTGLLVLALGSAGCGPRWVSLRSLSVEEIGAERIVLRAEIDEDLSASGMIVHFAYRAEPLESTAPERRPPPGGFLRIPPPCCGPDLYGPFEKSAGSLNYVPCAYGRDAEERPAGAVRLYEEPPFTYRLWIPRKVEEPYATPYALRPGTSYVLFVRVEGIRPKIGGSLRSDILGVPLALPP